MGLQDVAFLPSLAICSTNASGPPHVFKLWLWVGKDTLPVKKYLQPNKASVLCQSDFMVS